MSKLCGFWQRCGSQATWRRVHASFKRLRDAIDTNISFLITSVLFCSPEVLRYTLSTSSISSRNTNQLHHCYRSRRPFFEIIYDLSSMQFCHHIIHSLSFSMTCYSRIHSIIKLQNLSLSSFDLPYNLYFVISLHSHPSFSVICH